MEKNISFGAVRRQVVAALYSLAHALDKQIRPGAGAAVLGLPPDSCVETWPAYDDYDLSVVNLDWGLEVVYRYAVHAELSASAFISDDSESGNLGCLQSLVKMVYRNEIVADWADEVESICTPAGQEFGGLTTILDLASARLSLDEKKTITLPEIALLAGMNDRSVRNALHAEGQAMLVASRNCEGELVVEQSEALRWLRGRRGFKETVRIGHFGSTPVPERLLPEQIMPFIRERSRLGTVSFNGFDPGYAAAANRVGWTEERVRALVDGRLEDINPDDCQVIARMLLVDTGWFTAQVMQARFPKAMTELSPLAPQARPAPQISPLNDDASTLDVTLTDAGIRNGYFDIERRYADRFFPADCFGSRGAEKRGELVDLHHDMKDSPYATDLRIKSEAFVSPRKRFSAYFTAHDAKSGDVIRLKRTGERSYELTFHPK